MLIDSHAHLTDEKLAPEVPALLERARAAGVGAVVSVGTTPETSRAALALAEAHPAVYATAGVHPHYVAEAAPDALAEVERMAAHPRVVGIGETGLDYYYDHAPREAQRASFARHLELGARLRMPVVVHSRDADDDTAALIREAGTSANGVLHCFAGGEALLETALELGWYVSFSGMVTFARWDAADLLRRVPLDRLLVETDAPYLAPVPHRGRRNEPAYVALVARRAAELRGEDVDVLAAATVANTRRMYGLDGADA